MRQIANPILSIITINYNNASGLVKTMQSVIGQSWQDFEHIVVDGGSTDKSKDVILQYADRLTHWVSEPDQGIYHAMNKGIKMASGAYLLFLNSGDFLREPTVVQEAISQLDNYFDIIYTDLEIVADTGNYIKNYPAILSFKYFLSDTLPHPGSFIKRELFTKYGGYDESLRICADWKFFIEAICKHNVSYKHLDMVLACFLLNGISSSRQGADIIFKEQKECLSSSFPTFMPDYTEFDRWNKQRIVKWLKKIHLLK